MPAGRHFLQIPGPTNVPDRVLRAIDRPTIDHRGPEFQVISKDVLEGMKRIFRTRHPVIIYPASGTGAWEAALVNTLSPGDKVLMSETGHFAALWFKMATKLGLAIDMIPGDWRHGADHAEIEKRLRADTGHAIKAVCASAQRDLHGLGPRASRRAARDDNAKHPALLMVDTISSLASIDYRHDEWGVDVTVGGSQKGLMLPPGLSFNAISENSLAASKSAKLPRSFWDWAEMIPANADGWFPYTPSTNLLYGLREAIAMLEEEGLAKVFARHTAMRRTRARARRGPGSLPGSYEYSSSLTAILMPPGHDSDKLREAVLRISTCARQGLTKLKEKFPPRASWDFNDLTLAVRSQQSKHRGTRVRRPSQRAASVAMDSLPRRRKIERSAPAA